jgi:RNA polymerase sigma-70 factor (ECF subfamily)
VSQPPPGSPETIDVTVLLERWQRGDTDALESACAVVYPEMHRIARAYLQRERPGHTLQPTALVHEAFLRLTSAGTLSFAGRKQFLALAAQLMRRILVDHARALAADKRGSRAVKVPLEDIVGRVDHAAHAEEFLALHETLDRLGAFDARKARIIELRYFGGLTLDETAHLVGVSIATAQREQRLAEAWLSEQLGAPPS